MSKEELEKAFEGRWRVKGSFGRINQNSATMSFDEFHDFIKDMCFDFFEAGVLLGEGGHEATYSEVCDVNAPFEQFWCVYDKKVGRPKCEKLWSKLTMDERIACLNYIPLYKQAQPSKQYRKNPETFLRNKSWNDELIYRDNGNKPTSQNAAERLTDILIG